MEGRINCVGNLLPLLLSGPEKPDSNDKSLGGDGKNWCFVRSPHAFNIFARQEWYDDKLRWEPSEYGGVGEIYVPSEIIWLPDIILYNK